MRHRIASLSLLLAACCTSSPPRSVVVRAGRLIDGTGAPAQQNVIIRIEDGSIVAVEPDSGETRDEETAVIDARHLTLLPGLVNAHTHLFSSGTCEPGVGAGIGQAVRNLHALLAGGVTTVADLGAPVELAVALRRYVGTARQRGPRVLVAGPLVTAPGGYPGTMLGRRAVESGLVREVGSRREARQAVRDIAQADADLIKVAVQEYDFDGAPLPMLDGEVLCTVTREAHRQELRVVAHATTVRSTSAALDCDVDAIGHGSLEPLPDELIARLVAQKTPVAPTQFVFEAPLWGPTHLDLTKLRGQLSDEAIESLRDWARQDAEGGEHLPPHLMPGIERARAHAAVATLADNTRRMAKAGVLLGLGTDQASCFYPAGSPLEDLRRLRAAGIEPLDVLRIASHGGARILNLHDALGVIRAGYRADLIGVEGRPDVDLDDIAAVRLVLIDGVEQSLDGPTWGQHLAAGIRIGWAAR